jgi:hypothetical protein
MRGEKYIPASETKYKCKGNLFRQRQLETPQHRHWKTDYHYVDEKIDDTSRKEYLQFITARAFDCFVPEVVEWATNREGFYDDNDTESRDYPHEDVCHLPESAIWKQRDIKM